MNRREFIAGIAGVASVFGLAGVQQAELPTVIRLTPSGYEVFREAINGNRAYDAKTIAVKTSAGILIYNGDWTDEA